MLGFSAGSMAGAAILRVLQALSSLTSHSINEGAGLESDGEQEEQAIMKKLNIALDPLWEELSECISVTETQLGQSSFSQTVSNINVGEHVQGTLHLLFRLEPRDSVLSLRLSLFSVKSYKQTNPSHSKIRPI